MSGTKKSDWISKIKQDKVDISNLGSNDNIDYGDFFPIMEWLSNHPKLTQKIFVTNCPDANIKMSRCRGLSLIINELLFSVLKKSQKRNLDS